MKKLETSYSLNYTSRDADSRDTNMDITINFDNPTDTELMYKLNTWLVAINSTLIVTYRYNEEDE